MKKYLIFLMILVTSCTNIDKKEHYYNNSIKLNIVFNKSLETFENGYLRIKLWSKDMELLDEKIIYDISHKYSNTNNKKILVNFNNFDRSLYTTITIELFANTKDNDILEKFNAEFKDRKNINELIYEIR